MRHIRYLLGLAFLSCLMALCSAPAQAASWELLESNDRYSKYYDPATVKVIHRAQTPHGDVPTAIDGWTMATYTDAGARETIRNYGIQDILPDPGVLSNHGYSMALLRINPQNRTVQYLREDFYNAEGRVIWSNAEGKTKEVNSRSYDEAFYAAIVDQVFRYGEMARRKSKERWITLWEEESSGARKTVTADTSTMRLRGANLILWEWEELRSAEGKVLEIKFMKKAVNLNQGTERIMVSDSEYWSPQTKWQALEDERNGAYRMIQETSPEHKGLERLRAFAKGYSRWVTRYSLEEPPAAAEPAMPASAPALAGAGKGK